MGKPIISGGKMTGMLHSPDLPISMRKNKYGKYKGTWEGDTFIYDTPRANYAQNPFVRIAMGVHGMDGTGTPTPQKKTLGTSGGSTSSSGTSTKRRRTVLSGVSMGSGQSSILGRSTS